MKPKTKYFVIGLIFLIVAGLLGATVYVLQVTFSDSWLGEEEFIATPIPVVKKKIAPSLNEPAIGDATSSLATSSSASGSGL